VLAAFALLALMTAIFKASRPAMLFVLLVSSIAFGLSALLLEVLVLGSLVPSATTSLRSMPLTLQIGATTIIPLAVMGRSAGGEVQLDARAGG
jgi:hypothetical protein